MDFINHGILFSNINITSFIGNKSSVKIKINRKQLPESKPQYDDYSRFLKIKIEAKYPKLKY